MLRDQALAVIRAVGVETGGSNIQFAVNPADGEVVVIEMNPRVSRSSALASKATGLPDREDRRPARGRLRARGDPERHHAPHAGLVRAHDRLRGREDPALRLREVPARRGRPHHADEERGGGDGDRAHVQAGVHEGDALARAGRHAGRARRRRGAAGAPGGSLRRSLGAAVRGAAARASASRSCIAAPRSIPGSWTSSPSSSRRSRTRARTRLRAARTSASPTSRRGSRARSGSRRACSRPSGRSTPARPSSRPRRPTSTPPTSAR